MHKIISLLLLYLLLYSYSVSAIDTHILTQIPDTPAPWIVRAYYDNQQQLQTLAEITSIWQVNSQQNYAVLMLQDQSMLDKILAFNINMRLDTALQKQYFTENKKLKPGYIAQRGDVIEGFACYSTVEGTFARMLNLVDQNPSLAQIINIGDSWEKTMNANNGYQLKVLKITNQAIVEQKPIVFITTAIHAREYTTAELSTRFAEYLLAQYAINADVQWMLDHQEIHLLIHTNPDGRKKAETGILWRKNTNQAYCAPTSNNRGADLNRNYPFFWQSNNDQCGETFPGSSAASEPEVSAVMNHLNSIYADMRGDALTDAAPADTAGVFLDIHSFSQLVLWPWGFTSTANPNVSQYQAFGKRVAFYNNYTPEPITDLTIAHGGSVDSSYGELGVASLAFELGTSFFQDCATFESRILPDNLEALLYVTRVARTPYITPFGPDLEGFKIIPNYVLAGQNFNLIGNANDDRYNQSNGNQSFENIQKVEVYVNDLPWLGQNSQSIAALDGAYDNSQEKFNSPINTTGLPLGQHKIYAMASDSNSVAGAVNAKFLHIVDEASIGTVSGRITDAITGAAITAAQITLEQSIGLSNNTGNYTLLSPPTTANLAVMAEGYVAQTVANINVTQQQQTSRDIQLQPFCEVFVDDVESANMNWTATSPWAIVTNQSASPTHAWTDSPNGDYANNINKSLTSESIAIAGAESLALSFKHLCDTEAGFDFGNVEVNFDNTGWQNVLSCSGQSVWKSETIGLNMPVNSQHMQLRFRLTSDSFVTADGWYIDDIRYCPQKCVWLS